MIEFGYPTELLDSSIAYLFGHKTQMKLGTRLTIHAGVNFVLSPFAGIDRPSCWKFQENLENMGINISNIVFGDREFVVARQTPAPLEVKVIVAGPQIGQLLIISPQPGRALEVLTEEIEDVARAFSAVWFLPHTQILTCDSTVRDLYDTDSEQTFQQLWEKRLHQASDGLRVFGRPVLGGGLRFVMPPTQEGPDPIIEVKIESFLSDTRKLFLETQFVWRQSTLPGYLLDPANRLMQVDNYIQKEVVSFITEGL
jgi:hypothetical protein